ncbi:MAG: TetR/AcrR family transcriptional regulator [Acidobacteria bacterium]|nr:TetR/AcrR family transcriptional regulator [Acidobacteriota bacterium]
MPIAHSEEQDEERRKQILEASIHCFLAYGFSNTSMKDIAREARIARPLIYLKFKGKEDLFAYAVDYLMDWHLERAGVAAQSGLSKRERLSSVCEILLVYLWSKRDGYPGGADFYEACTVRVPEMTAAYARNFMRLIQEILGDHERAEVFYFAMEGLYGDLPSTKVLLKRLRVLIAQFAREDEN